jgi:type I restriction enzyme, S subunit
MKWGDIVKLEYGKGLRAFVPGKYPVFGTNGQIGWHNEPLCFHPGIIIGRKGAYRGVHYSKDSFYVIDTAFYVEPKIEMDMKWAYYQLLTQDINGMDSGSAIPSTSRDSFYNLDVLLPPLPEQKRIASILGSLDDKIELNRRMNETLEALARAIFKSWFVDFDPVKAKMDGRQPLGMDADTAALFPDSFEESSLGMIPKGWRVGKVKEICQKVENGGTPRRDKQEYWESGTIPWLTSGEVKQNIIIDTQTQITELGFTYSSAKLWQSGTTVVALYGATAGKVSLLASDMCSNQACCGLTPIDFADYYLYLSLSSKVENLALQARGSAQQNLSQQLVSDFIIVIPDLKILEEFYNIIKPLFDKWIANLQENRTLAKIRDTLLPKLFNGDFL